MKITKSIVATVCLTLIIILAHTLFLERVPTGFYRDEISVGYNAALIAYKGIDETGTAYPIHFTAFGDYKSPIYIYVTALIFKIFGVSEYGLRFTSVLLYFLALVCIVILVSKLFQGNRPIHIYALVSFGFLPAFFIPSRISLESISQLTWISAANLLIWWIFHRARGKQRYSLSIFCGVILGTSIYTYTTARLLTLLAVLSLWLIYWGRKRFPQLLIITSTFALSLVPYIAYTINSPGSVSTRFRALSYLYETIPLHEKVLTFIGEYTSYFSPMFLLFTGDRNLRHSLGYRGVIFVTTLILFVIGITQLFKTANILRFKIFLAVNLLTAPLAASFTNTGTPHNPRSLLLGYYILLISCYGLQHLLQRKTHPRKQRSLKIIFYLLVFEISTYQLDYFLFYSHRSFGWMEGFGIKQAFEYVIDQNPTEIVFMDNPENVLYVHPGFYTFILDDLNSIPVSITRELPKQKNNCIIYHESNENIVSKYPTIPTSTYQASKPRRFIEKLLNLKGDTTSLVKAKCFRD